MPSYKTIAQILIATSAVGSALAAPAPAHRIQDARNDLSQSKRAFKDEWKGIAATYAAAGVVAGAVAGVANAGQKWMSSKIETQKTQARGQLVDSTPSFPDISPRLAGLSDDDLRLLNDISRRALDSLG